MTNDIYDDAGDEAVQKRIEYPEGRTYGECIEDEKRSVRMINGRFVSTLQIKNKPFRLSRAEALDYYTKKLQKVWEAPLRKQYDRKISVSTPINSKDKTLL